MRRLIFLLYLICIPSYAFCDVIKSDLVWEGEVFLSEDILIPEGRSLTILPGTVIRVSPSENTKTDPEYLSPLSEITVRGTLKAEGKKGSPIIFTIGSNPSNPHLPKGGEGGFLKYGAAGAEKNDVSNRWAGIIVDGGMAVLSSCNVRDAEAGITVIKGSADIIDSLIKDNRYGMVAAGNDSKLLLKNALVSENDYGVFLLNNARMDKKKSRISGNKKKDLYSAAAKDFAAVVKESPAGTGETARVYGNEVLLGSTVWQGRIRVNGIIRVPEKSRLIILPGTLIEFIRNDTNGDGIGENGLLIQGVIVAKGTPERQIVFRSAEKKKGMGDWDAVNIMNSDGAQNLVEYCRIEDAYRGLHFHFSNVVVKGSVLKNNYRGIQFQESVVEIDSVDLFENRSGMQARDSEIVFRNSRVLRNHSGVNIFRSAVAFKGNVAANNLREGLRMREGVPVIEENLFEGNRFGALVSDSVYGSFSRNVVSHNLESGMHLRGIDNVEISGNFIQANGLNGINIQDSRAVIRGNHISGNGERGIGITSFDGVIVENDIIHNGTLAIDHEGGMEIAASLNWWGNDNPDSMIFDKNDDPKRGRVLHEPARSSSISYAWPLRTVSVDAAWYADISVRRPVEVLKGATLKILPGASVTYSDSVGMKISGRISAVGTRDGRIVFTSSSKKSASDWDEILLDHATGSRFAYCDFEHATWGIHSHFTDLEVSNCRFTGSYGGLRFRSGPLAIRRSVFENNHIGIRAFRGSAEITGSIIARNDIGLFVREKGAGLSIRNNNIFDNAEYNIRNGDFNAEDVDARDNWWGSDKPSDTIYDDRREPGIGRVIFEPFRKEPYKYED